MDRNLLKKIYKDIDKVAPLRFLKQLLKLIVESYGRGEMFIIDKDSRIEYILVLSVLTNKNYIITFENSKIFKSIGILPAKKLMNLLNLLPKPIKGVPVMDGGDFSNTATSIPSANPYDNDPYYVPINFLNIPLKKAHIIPWEDFDNTL